MLNFVSEASILTVRGLFLSHCVPTILGIKEIVPQVMVQHFLLKAVEFKGSKYTFEFIK